MEYKTIHQQSLCEHCHFYAEHVNYHLHGDSDTDTGDDFLRGQRQTLSKAYEMGRREQLKEDHELFSRYRSRLASVRARYDEEVLLRRRYRREMEILQTQLSEAKDQLLALQLAYGEVVVEISANAHPAHRSPLPHSPPSNSTTSTQLDAECAIRSQNSWSDDLAIWDDEDEFDAVQQVHMMEEFRKENSCFDDTSVDDSDESLMSSPACMESNLTSDSESSASINEPRPDQFRSPLIPEIAQLMLSAHEGNVSSRRTILQLIRTAENTPKSQRTAEHVYVLLKWRKRKREPADIAPTRDAFDSVSSNVTPAAAIVGTILHSIQPATPVHANPELFVDASGYGIGLIFADKWLAWTFNPVHPSLPLGPDRKIVMSWAEIVAAELGIRTLLAAGQRNVPVTIRSDNIGVVNALNNRHSTPNYGVGVILKRILRLCRNGGLDVRAIWVSTKLNPADGPSRGRYPPRSAMLESRPKIPVELDGLIRDVDI